jgi:hypothetical protein
LTRNLTRPHNAEGNFPFNKKGNTMNKFAILRAGNGNPPPVKPRRSEAPVDDQDETPPVETPAEPK